MSERPQKRKAVFSGLQRRVRPRVEREVSASIASSDEERGPVDDGSEVRESDGEESEDEEGEESTSASDDASQTSGSAPDEASEAIENVSPGALAKAQALMGQSIREGSSRLPNHGQPADDVPAFKGPDWLLRLKSTTTKPVSVRTTSKHAPQEISSSRPVTRKREILGAPETAKVRPRDPRFDKAVGALDEDKFRRAYSFLDDYRDSEMADLRKAIKKTKDARQKRQLQQALMRMESRKKAQLRKDREATLIEEHRMKEKELVGEGKKPFFLKRSEVKKQLLVNQFEGMKKRQVDKVIERKRKKIVARERKELPMERRGYQD